MQNLSIDIETYSSNDLKTGGVYHYVEAPDFAILLFAYSFDGAPVEIVDLAQGEEIPFHVLTALLDSRVLKTAHNANFERVCISAYLKKYLSPQKKMNGHENLPVDQWECSMTKAAMLGLPLALKMVALALKLEQQKDTTGKALIKYFSMPCKPTKANGMRTRNLPEHAPEKWQAFKNYCIQDVVTETSVREKISYFSIPVNEVQLWNLDQKINDRGILLDTNFILNVMRIDSANAVKLYDRAQAVTGLGNPNSPAQLKAWLTAETGATVKTLAKEATALLLKENIETWGDERVTELLTLRQEMSKTSIKKYAAMLAGKCSDDRIRGIHQHYGANRTGRWAGRLVQPQNMPRIAIGDIDLARQLVLMGDAEMIELCYGIIPNVLSQLIRTAFVAGPGKRFIIADFSAIEAVVIAWLAGEKWRMEVFRTHGKIYEASASKMFNVPIESIGKGSTLRQKGKVSELSLGYQGGPNALIKMGALEMGIEESELPRLVAMWRRANPAIVRLWATVEEAAKRAVESGEAYTSIQYGIKFFVKHDTLFIQLPSGRRLAYVGPRMKISDYGYALHYWGMDQTTKQWREQTTYGGKLVENIIQAIARDCLAKSMLNLDALGYDIVMHVHDEVVLEMPFEKGSTEEVNAVMAWPIAWAPGLPLRAESYESLYYKKE